MIKLGTDAFIIKPFEREYLIDTVQGLLEIKNA